MSGTLLTSNEPRWRSKLHSKKKPIEPQNCGRFLPQWMTVIMVYDRQGYCLKITPTDVNLLYRPTQEQEGKSVYENLPESQAALHIQAIQRTLETQQTTTFEYSLVLNHQESWFSAKVSPLSDDTVIMVARDITERKQMENALRREQEKSQGLNERLKAENQRLGTELEIVRRMQQMILPKLEELANIEGSRYRRVYGACC